jgi:hypothetical protein
MLTKGKPTTWVIDFQRMGLVDVQQYTEPFQHLLKNVLPHIQELANAEKANTGRETGQDHNWLRTWWQHFRCRSEMLEAIGENGRYIACLELTKRPIFCFVSTSIRPDKTIEAFSFADDYSFGVLQSSPHWRWFVAKCSKFKSDFRYTPESVFDTFPWPQSPSMNDVEAIADAAREVRRIRSEALKKVKGSLRALYRVLELPGKHDLNDAHATLDAAVIKAYGFCAKDDRLKQLLDLNIEVAARIVRGEAVIAPGIPPDFPNPKSLITDDCIRPAD